MSYFAHIDPNTKIVTQVIVINEDTLSAAGGWPILGTFRDKSEFVQTSYNVRDGRYKGADINEGSPEDVAARKRKNYAGIGYTYDTSLDAFLPPRLSTEHLLDETTGTWRMADETIREGSLE